MKVIFWDTEIPKDRITICVILLIPLYYIARTIIASSGGRHSDITGATNAIRIRGDTFYLTDLSFYTVSVISIAILALIFIIAISGLSVAYNWYKSIYAR
jgi:hypothetical protein